MIVVLIPYENPKTLFEEYTKTALDKYNEQNNNDAATLISNLLTLSTIHEPGILSFNYGAYKFSCGDFIIETGFFENIVNGVQSYVEKLKTAKKEPNV